ncbi:MAG: YciI family protein [Pseudomonadales bacterium]
MLFMIISKDHADSTELRANTRPKHLDYLQSHDVRYAGPILSDDETQPIGSAIVIEAQDLAAARAFAANDPYTVAGLFAEVNVHPFKQVIPESNS